MKVNKRVLIVGGSAAAVVGIVLVLVIVFGGIFGGAGKSDEEVQDEVASSEVTATPSETPVEEEEVKVSFDVKNGEKTSTGGTSCPTTLGNLMLINPNFKVSTSWIAEREKSLVNLTEKYGIKEGKASNGTPRLTAEAGEALNKMLTAYHEETGGTFTMRSCFRSKGTNCGRLCYATGTSDHHTGLTCDLVDTQYGDTLDTDYYGKHPDWQWLKKNSSRFGFIDRFPAEWAGGPMSKPVNVDKNGSTGLYETWHYRYVGVAAAQEIASGKYNNGKYDSLEHYLLMKGLVTDLLGPAKC